MNLRAEPPAFDVFIVDWVMPGGPAAVAGLLPGDRLDSLDGRPAAEFRLEGLVGALAQSGKTVRFILTRDGKRQKVVLRLRPLS